MVAAIAIGSAVVGAGATVVSSNAASRASRRATDKTIAAQTQARDQNTALLSPYVGAGNRATSAIEAMLGISAPAQTAQTRPAWSFNGVDYYSDGQGGFTNQKPAAASPSTTASNQNAAFETFRNSAGYQFQKGEGEKAITAALGRSGQLESGAAVKSALKFNQNIANQSAYQYLGSLQNQQNVGLSAANATAGVGTNFANAASNAYQNQGNTQANAALSVGNAVNSALGSAVSAYGYSQGLKSSYAQPNDGLGGIY